ncbi:Mitochondrial enolase superfamily member 1 [Camponotus floridanus]|uniref:Mitochondrial enolase superfamily member 1 n=1 Tax=Camponotus floridanus TaxID=104421 RepID=E2AZB8_CAMFO|nr:mitochondrial enolase superfamily member 1 [Camponotus floridanus]EFN61216.1 Mitochondrial enolase superfamily member 1 [Camponotus floridanus]
MIDAKIIDIDVQDIRFPTSLWGIGSDSMDPNINHSCVYVTIKTDKEYEGYGITCTVGRGNELVLRVCKLLFKFIKYQTTIEIYTDFASVWRRLRNEFRLVEPECGIVYLAAAAIINALWDLWARIENKPVWKLLTDMTPEQLVSTVDFRYITNFLSQKEAIQMLQENEKRKDQFENVLKKNGFPAYTADVGWVRYPYQKTRDLSKKFAKLDFKVFKTSLDLTIEKSTSRCKTIRKTIGKKKSLILDANQAWDETEVLDYMENLKDCKIFYLEDPIFPDDIIGYSLLSADLGSDIKLVTGKMCANRIIQKQFKNMSGPDICVINVARLGINEALAIYLMLKKARRTYHFYNTTWSCANGVGLSEMNQHLQMWDFICLTQSTEKQHMIEFVNHQHGYFENPIHIQNACYMPPKYPGFSTKLKNKCIARWSYPEGTRWQYLFDTKHFQNEYKAN